MTVNLIVGIISIPPPRTVRIQKWGKDMDLIEMIVGDDTKAGFGMTFWLAPSKDSHSHPAQEDQMRKSLKGLRPQDIVILRNVALRSFQGQVHGQSLRRNMTSAGLLYRRKVDRDDVGGVYSTKDLNNAPSDDRQLIKVKKVREWILNFVSGVEPSTKYCGDKNGGVDNDGRKRRKFLPPDTQ
jgi:hypothetical protein